MKLTFEQWKFRVNLALIAKCGCGADDLPDVDYSGWYLSGMKPDTAARKAIREALE